MQFLWAFDPTNGSADDSGMSDYLLKNLAFLLQGDQSRQAALAAKAGTTQPTISKWSRLYASQSKAEPGFRSMAKLCAALGVSLDDLASRDLETDGPAGQSQPVGFDTAKLADLIETVEAAVSDAGRPMPPQQKAAVLATLYADSRVTGASDEAVRATLVSILLSQEPARESDPS